MQVGHLILRAACPCRGRAGPLPTNDNETPGGAG